MEKCCFVNKISIDNFIQSMDVYRDSILYFFLFARMVMIPILDLNQDNLTASIIHKWVQNSYFIYIIALSLAAIKI